MIVDRVEPRAIHRCKPGAAVKNGSFDLDLFAPAGSVWLCGRGRTWIAFYDTSGGFLGAQWRRESRLGRWRRVRKQAA